jgi:hypothetical protein
MKREELFWDSFENSCNNGISIFDIECAYKNGKEILHEIKIISPFENKEDIEHFLNEHKKSIKNVKFNIVGFRKQRYMGDGFDFIFVYKNDTWVNKMKPVSKIFKSFLLSQKLHIHLSEKIPMNKILIQQNLILIYIGAYCDDEKGYINCVIYGAKTQLMLTWNRKDGGVNVYPSDSTFNPNTLEFGISEFDPTAFINYVKSIKKQPKFFNDLQLGFKVREKMNTHGEDYLEIKFKFLQKDKNIVEATIEKIKDFIEERKTTAVIEEHMKEEYFRYFKFKDIKADSFTFDLDLGTGDIEELHNIFYLLDETKNIKSVYVTLK